MNDALIGWSGFVGQTLLRQRDFSRTYRSSDVHHIRGADLDLMVIAGAPAKKWIADREPEADRANLARLADALDEVRAERVVLISTVDVFADSRGADEGSDPDVRPAGPYGTNRRWLETRIAARFPGALIVRLPGLVGAGLRKNALFDLLNDNNLAAVDARGVFQFYPMSRLWADLEIALRAGLKIVHLTAEPVSITEAATEGFGRAFDNRIEGREPAAYDFQTRHADLWGKASRYQYDRAESLAAIRDYAATEPRSPALA